MKTYLLYPDRELTLLDKYYDAGSIIRDLELKVLFDACANGVSAEYKLWSEAQVKDNFLVETMRRVMMVPIKNKEELYYRQNIMKDLIARENFTCEFYDILDKMMKTWDKYGRKTNENRNGANPKVLLANEIKIMKLFVDTLGEISEKLESVKDRLESKGMKDFVARFFEEFNEEKLIKLNKVVDDIIFFTDINSQAAEDDKEGPLMNLPEVVIECGFGDGLKLGDFAVEKLATFATDYRDPYGLMSSIHDVVGNFKPSSFSTFRNTALKDQMDNMIYQAVSYVVDYSAPFREEMRKFYTTLQQEFGFYRAALNLRANLKKVNIDMCFPRVESAENLNFLNLKEAVMAMRQKLYVVGNSCQIQNKTLLIVTGANQGGKSTFLRSIGIAQIMMQCGMFVPAEKYESGLFNEFFTHFTRREDSSMNSGRLDEELKRMSQIIDHLGSSSLVLLNESFASTTEKEGSQIAYGIITALQQKHVKVLTVTHLLSFAQKVYDDKKVDPNMQVEFLSAERLPNGERTYRMINHEPELTSFGLDLYDEIVGNPDKKE